MSHAEEKDIKLREACAELVSASHTARFLSLMSDSGQLRCQYCMFNF